MNLSPIASANGSAQAPRQPKNRRQRTTGASCNQGGAPANQGCIRPLTHLSPSIPRYDGYNAGLPHTPHEPRRIEVNVSDPTAEPLAAESRFAIDGKPLSMQTQVDGQPELAFFKFAAGMRAILALAAVFTLMSAGAIKTSQLHIWLSLVYATTAALVLAITMHDRAASRWAAWFWIDAALIVAICNSSLSNVPGLAALLMLPLIALALHFSVWHSVSLAVVSAVALMVPYWAFGTDAAINLKHIPLARLGVAMSIVACGPLAVWLLRPARASQRHTQLIDKLTANASPRHGLALNVQGLVGLLSEEYNFDKALVSLGGPEPRIFRWTRSQSLRILGEDEAAQATVRLAHVATALTLMRDELGHAMARTIDVRHGKMDVLGDAVPWIWITQRGGGIVVPLLSFGQSIGHLWLSEALTPFIAADAVWLSDIMDTAMPLLERADLMEQLQREGAMRERDRIGRDLHDSAVQPYVGLKYGLEALVRQTAQTNPAHAGLQQLLQLTNDELQRLRDVVCGLRSGNPAATDESPLAAIERQVKRFETIYGLKVQIFAPHAIRLRGAVGKHVLHIINEALTNVRRHTSAKAVSILIDVDDNDIVLSLRNDHGPQETLPDTFIPTSIQQRANELGGTVAVHHDQGFTEVNIRMPTLGVLG